MKPAQSATTVLFLAFTAIYLVWGTTYLAGMLALEGLPPFLISGLRCLLAGSLLGSWVLARGIQWPGAADLKGLSISGIVMLIGGSGLVIYAEQYIGSGYAAVIVATEPLWFVILDRSRWKEYFGNRWIVMGLLIGFAGIILFAVFSGSGSSTQAGGVFLGTVILLLSAVLWVGGALYNSRLAGKRGTTVSRTAVQLLAAGVFAIALSGTVGEFSHFSFAAVSGRAWFGLMYLVLMGSLVAYLAFTWLVTVQPPAVVGTHTYVNPVVAVLAGYLVYDERITGMQVMALVVVLVGVLITQVSNLRGKRPA